MRAHKVTKDKHRTLTSNHAMSQKQAIVCSYMKCGKTFHEPIELTLWAGGSLETYYACPHCFSRVETQEELNKHSSEALPLDALKEALRDNADGLERHKPTGCAHFCGWLKTRPKNSQIPDECLLCSKILECMKG